MADMTNQGQVNPLTGVEQSGGMSAMDQQYGQPQSVRKGVWIEKLEQLLIFTYLVVAALLMFRFVLSLFGANRTVVFVNFIYQLTGPFMFAFEGMFGRKPQVGQYVLEFEVLVALLVYALVFVGLSRLVRILFK